MVRPITLAPDINGKILGIVPLTQGKQSIIDLKDVERVMQYNWNAARRHTQYKTEYNAVRNEHLRYENGKQLQKKIRMSRFILDAPDHLLVDHINGEPLDNRRANLRLVTSRENSQNRHHERTSEYPGVFLQKNRQKWQASIQINGKIRHLGYFRSEKEAAETYQKAANELKDDS